MPLVEATLDDTLGTIVMSNLERRNALSEALIGEIIAALERFREARARVVILRAPPGTRTWCAGHDIDELPARGRDPLGWGDSLRVLVRAIQEFPAPIIALIEGGVWGGGCEVALACDIRVATPESTFAITPAKLGIPYNLSGVLTLLNAIPLSVAKEMLFTAQPLPIGQAHNFGMVNYVVPGAEIDAFVRTMAAQIAANAPLSISVMKEELRLLAGAHPVTPELFERIQGQRRVVYDSTDYGEGLQAFREKRKPRFTGR